MITRRLHLAIIASLLALAAEASETDFGGTKPPATKDTACISAAPGLPCSTVDPRGLGHVELATGEYVLEEEDLRIPGVGFDFVMRRKYVSRGRAQSPESIPGNDEELVSSPLGPGWDFSYNLAIESESDMASAMFCTCELPDPCSCSEPVSSLRLSDGTARFDLFGRIVYDDANGERHHTDTFTRSDRWEGIDLPAPNPQE